MSFIAGFGVLWFIGLLINLGISIWIYKDSEKRDDTYGALWAVLSFIFFPVVVLVYLIVTRVVERKCPKCNRTIGTKSNACPYCGERVTESCSHCGAPTQKGWRYCPNCSKEINSPVEKKNDNQYGNVEYKDATYDDFVKSSNNEGQDSSLNLNKDYDTSDYAKKNYNNNNKSMDPFVKTVLIIICICASFPFVLGACAACSFSNTHTDDYGSGEYYYYDFDSGITTDYDSNFSGEEDEEQSIIESKEDDGYLGEDESY